MDLYGGIEAGGTKFICAVGTNPADLHDLTRIATRSPETTIQQVIAYFKQQEQKNNLLSIGIGSFGPLDINKSSSAYGHITSTPKPGWKNTNIYGKIRAAFPVPVGFDTDVNAAALGEYRWGAARGLSDFIYLTVGTGIGGGGMSNGRLLHGLLHPEMGHILIPHDSKEDPYQGKCPFHKNCFEGLASGPALKERWGEAGENLSDDHRAWDLEAEYISYALINYICTLSPQRIIIGGGVMQRKKLLPLIHEQVRKRLNDYIHLPEIEEEIEKYIVLPALGNRAGILGALALAEQSYLNGK
jgi:fructokinase